MDLGKNIRSARRSAGFTQEQLAERLGVYQKDISRWENNSLTPNITTFREICIATNSSADEILELEK